MIIWAFIRVHSWWECIVQRFPMGPRELSQPTAPSIPHAKNPDPSICPIIATFPPREVFRRSAELLQDPWSCSAVPPNSSRNLAEARTLFSVEWKWAQHPVISSRRDGSSSRRLSAATPPVAGRGPRAPRPGCQSKPAQGFWHPAWGAYPHSRDTGGVAARNPRLPSGILPGCPQRRMLFHRKQRGTTSLAPKG